MQHKTLLPNCTELPQGYYLEGCRAAFFLNICSLTQCRFIWPFLSVALSGSIGPLKHLSKPLCKRLKLDA